MSEERIVSITLDEGSIRQRSPEVEHERKVAIADLLAENQFEPASLLGDGPYEVRLSAHDQRLRVDIGSPSTLKTAYVAFSLQPLKGIIRDYFMICESYYEALKATSPGRLEAIDMGRRGMHDEGAQILMEILKGRIGVDFPTARRLFTLICVLQIK